MLNPLEYEYVPRTQKTRQRSTRLNDSIVMETLRAGQAVDDNWKLKLAYFKVKDFALHEMERRFYENSDSLMAIGEFNNINSRIFNVNAPSLLTNIGLVLLSEAELYVVRMFVAEDMTIFDNKKRN